MENMWRAMSALACLALLGCGDDGANGQATGECDAEDTRPCGSDEGACQPGVQTCVEGQWSECVGGTGPASETCNGIDDDCNGDTDETCCVESGWETTQLEANGVFPSIATDADGGIHLSFVAVPVRDVQYAFRAVGGDWVFEPVAAPSEGAEFTALAVTESGVHIAYETIWRLLHAYRSADGDWNETLVDLDVALYTTSIAIDSSGEVHLSYGVLTGVSRDTLRHAYGPPEGPWEAEPVYAREEEGRIGDSSIAVDDAGGVFIASAFNIPASREGTVFVASREPGLSWSTEELEGPGLWVLELATAMDGQGDLHIGWSYEGPPPDAYYGHRERTSNEWTWELVAGLLSKMIAVDPFNVVHIVAVGYEAGNMGFVEHIYGGLGSWDVERAVAAAQGRTYDASVAMDPFGGLHLVYERGADELWYAYSCVVRGE